MKTDELREKYLDFFVSKGCIRRPSDVLVPKDDPSVLFTPAGMNQFKNQFLGIGPLDFTKATTCQKCLRTGDINNVGVTAYHHTFFEMLGNFSFGDYFKKEAIHWAWEFLTAKKWLGLDGSRLTVTVYLDDDEASNIWEKEIGLPLNRIKRENEYENFWPAGAPTDGPDGVCGPCSEIYYHPPSGGKEVEIWNLVFTQFNRVGAPPDNLRPLPKKNIDTGMGLERTAAVLQGFESNFEIDTLRPLCESAADIVGVKYEFHGPAGRPVRRIADHLRACTFAIHEGCLPGNEKEHYVIRLLLRRASMEAFRLGRHEPCLSQLVAPIARAMKGAYPELSQTIEIVAQAVDVEEKQFLAVVDRGIQRFRKMVDKARGAGEKLLPGDDAFDLHQTDGFLIELTESLATAEGLEVDRPRFNSLMEQHKKTSGRGAFGESVMAEGPIDALRQRGATEFLGYATVTSESEVIGIIADKELRSQAGVSSSGEPIALVLNRTPFYGEAGGQVGDTGQITTAGFEFLVEDSVRNGDLIIHVGKVTKGVVQSGDKVSCRVDVARRSGIRRAHSATHLLHHALRKYLGENATQRGSKVSDDELRFDYAHAKGVSADELVQIEDEVNSRIAEGATIATNVMPIAEAKKLGAMALFGEKYPDNVRVVTMGDFSREFCGGTHLDNTGQVGLCRIVKDELIASGVRRVTCLTGQKAWNQVREAENLLEQISGQLRVSQPIEIPRKIDQLMEDLREARQQLAKFTTQSLSSLASQLLAGAVMKGDVKVVVQKVNCGRDDLKTLIDLLRTGSTSVASLLATEADGKVALVAALSKDLLQRGLNASDCVKQAAKECGGGGGGRPDLAEAGGKDPGKIEAALAAATKYLEGKLG